MKKNQTLKITLCSMFIAIGVILSFFSRMVTFGGGAGMRIGVSSYITVLPSLLFGPLYGGITMGLCDVLAYLIKPDGAYLLPLTLTAILGGILRGYSWRLVKTKHQYFLPSIVLFGFVTLFGVFNILMKNVGGFYGSFLAMFEKKLYFITIFPIVFGGISVLFLILNKLLLKTKLASPLYLSVLSAIMPVNILITTINTFLLMLLIPSLSKLAFTYFYIPRLIEEVSNTSIQCIAVSYLLKLTKKTNMF